MRTSILAWVVFGCLGAVAQQERVNDPECTSVSMTAGGQRWGEFNFEKCEPDTDANATDGKVIRCFAAKERFGKEVYGYDRFDSGAAQSIIPCPEPGSLYTFSARARLSGTGNPGQVFVEFVNAEGVKTRAVEFTVTSTDFTDFSEIFTVPSDAVWCHVWILQNDPGTEDLRVDSVSLKSADPDDTPAVPSGLSATAIGSSMVRLQWTAVAGARGYLIERKHASQDNSKYVSVWKTLEGGSATSFLDAIDTGTTTVRVLVPGETYKYRITALGDYGNSGSSSALSVTMASRSVSPGYTTYYVDAGGGDDANPGTSEGAAWKSFLPLDRIELAEGDQVLLKRGETWNEPMHLHGNGSLGSEIVVRAYGTAAERPKINAETRAHAAVRMIDVSHCRVADLELSNWHPFCRKTERYALEAGEWNADVIENLSFSNLVVNGVRAVANRGDSGSASDGRGGAGLRIVGNVRQPTQEQYGSLYDVSITDCVITNVEMFGIQLHDVNGAVIENNLTDWQGFCAILARRLNHSRIAYNTFRNAGVYLTCLDNAHLGFYGGTNVVIEFNVVDRTHNVDSGQSINLDGCDGYTVQYNYLKDSDGGSFVLNHQANENVFRYNVVEGISEGNLLKNLGGLNTRLYNNTVYTHSGQIAGLVYNGYTIDTAQRPATNCWCYNNIIYSAGGTIDNDLINNAAGTAGISISNNVYYGSFTDTPSEDGNPLYLDPQFEGPVGSGSVDGFLLSKTSPYIEAGVVVPNNGGLDYWGNAVSVSNRPSIGAHQPTGGSAYSTWSKNYSLVYGPEGDDDVDGLSNLAEYGFGGNPTNGFVDGNLPTFGSGSAGLEYIYAYRTDDATLGYTLETTTNLISNVWTNSGYTVTGTNEAEGAFGFITNLIDTAESKRFIRLKIDQH